MEYCLKFINNLLTEGGTFEDSNDLLPQEWQSRLGVRILLNQVDLLLEKFTERLDSGSCDFRGSSRMAYIELNTLCKVSKLLVNRDSLQADRMREKNKG